MIFDNIVALVIRLSRNYLVWRCNYLTVQNITNMYSVFVQYSLRVLGLGIKLWGSCLLGLNTS